MGPTCRERRWDLDPTNDEWEFDPDSLDKEELYNLLEAVEEAAVEVARRISADPLPVEAGDWQGCDGNGDKE